MLLSFFSKVKTLFAWQRFIEKTEGDSYRRYVPQGVWTLGSWTHLLSFGKMQQKLIQMHSRHIPLTNKHAQTQHRHSGSSLQNPGGWWFQRILHDFTIRSGNPYQPTGVINWHRKIEHCPCSSMHIGILEHFNVSQFCLIHFGAVPDELIAGQSSLRSKMDSCHWVPARLFGCGPKVWKEQPSTVIQDDPGQALKDAGK